MPIIYACSSCGFKTSLGWFHYQNFDSGYGSQTNLMCQECGARHVIQIGLARELLEEFYKRANVVIENIGTQPYEVRRILREATSKNRHDADAVIASMPGIFISELSYSTAQTILEKLERLNVVAHVDITQDVEYHKDLLFAMLPEASDKLQPCEVAGDYDAETGRFDLKEQECAFCHAKGTLISELPNSENNLCPVCKKPTLSAESEWRT